MVKRKKGYRLQGNEVLIFFAVGEQYIGNFQITETLERKLRSSKRMPNVNYLVIGHISSDITELG